MHRLAIRAALGALLLPAIVVSFVPLATADVVWEQLPGGLGFHSDLKLTPNEEQQLEADHFTPAQGGAITRVEWWMQGSDSFFGDFWIRFFSNVSGLPGELLFSGMYYDVLAVPDGDYTRFVLPLDGPVCEAGTAYWISIAGIDDYSGDVALWAEVFYWAASTGANGYARQFGPESVWYYADFDQPAFRLHMNTGAPLAPSSWGRVKALY